jgi:hypothetical protein
MTRLTPLVWSRGFALMLKDERHGVQGYEDMHWNFYEAVEKRIQDLHRSDPHTAQRVQRQLHFLSESGLRIEPVEGTHDMCLLLSSLPDRFQKEGVRAGTIFIDTFKATHRFAHLSPFRITLAFFFYDSFVFFQLVYEALCY